MPNDIVDERKEPHTYGSLKIGQVFLSKGKCYIKTDIPAESDAFIAVDMNNGQCAAFMAGVSVIPVGAEIHLI